MLCNFQVCIKAGMTNQPLFYPLTHMSLLPSPRVLAVKSANPGRIALVGVLPLLVLLRRDLTGFQLLLHITPVIEQLSEGDACGALARSDSGLAVDH